uniref:Uncharacterized protein n=1 Tax=Klebsiella pneumoniae TaxID=573 RepID=A0A483WDQ3_KLEPN
MKNINVPEISFIFDNDKTEVFSRMAMDNLALYVENMFKIMGDQLERHLYDEKNMNMVMDHIIYITKPDFLKWVRDNNVGECIFLIDEVMEDLKYSYREFKKIYPKLGIK